MLPVACNQSMILGDFEEIGSRKCLILIWLLPPRDSNPDMLIQSQISPSENKGNKDLHSAKRDQTRQKRANRTQTQ